MSVADENVLVVRRSLFEEVGAFQGFRADPEIYLSRFFMTGNNFFAPRRDVETDPSLKQIIPYTVFCHQGRILHYVRGGGGGEARLVAKGSIGIGGHINDSDGSLHEFDEAAYRRAVDREISEELRLSGTFEDRAVGMINDDETDVGRVHLGVVHLVELADNHVAPGEAVITDLEFLTPAAIRDRRDRLESWSQIVIDHWDEISD